MASEPVDSPARRRRKERPSPRGTFTNFRNESLPQASVHASFQDHRGYLWFGTEEGVVRFDGREWKPFGIADGLAYGFVQCIAEDREGCLWIGTRIGLSRFDPVHLRRHGWRSFDTRDGLADINVRSIAVDAEGTLWFATRSGLSRFDLHQRQFRSWTGRDNPACTDIEAALADARGRIWIASRHGAAMYDPARDRWRSFDLAGSHARALCQDNDGLIWIGTSGNGVVRLDPDSGTATMLTADDGLVHNTVIAAMCDRDGDLWFATEEAGLSHLRVQRAPNVPRWSALSVADGLCDYAVYSLLQDRSGAFWFGTLTGLTKFEPEGTGRGRTWSSVTSKDGLVHDPVASIAEDSAGRYWFGTFGRGASMLGENDGRPCWSSYDTAAGLGHNIVRAIAEDRRGRIWFGTLGGGLSRFDPAAGAWRTFTVADGLAGDAIRCLRSNARGELWAGTDGGGISAFDPQEETPRFVNSTAPGALPSNRVSTIVHARDERVWVGTYDGGVAVRGVDGSWRALSRSDGLPSLDIYCIAEDPLGRIWFGTGGSGLACFDGRSWRYFREKDGLPNDVIYQILVESERSIYCSTNRGVFRLRIDEDREIIIAFDRTDGLADDECNGGASLIDRRGRFWFGTLGGASCIDPAQVPERVAPCEVYITSFVVHDEPMDLDDVGEIEDSNFEFVFHYGAVEMVSPQKVRYQSRLIGFDRDWSKVTSERQIRYTNLRPGRYTFQVRAKNWGGEWSRPAEVSFVVVPDRARVAREEALERERIEKRVLETAHTKLQQLADELRTAKEQLELQAREDGLTRLLNRRYLDIHLVQEFERAVRFYRPLTIAIGDLDHFKSINDRFSHAVGDEVLRAAAQVMKSAVRSIDIVARYGGEEFVFILLETAGVAAEQVCEKIRRAVAEHPWKEIHPDLAVTMSIGFCDDTTLATAVDMLRVADEKLFEAKRGGRDRICG